MELICGLTPICSANCRVKLEGLKEAERRVGDIWSYLLAGTQSFRPGSKSVEVRPFTERI